MIESIAEKLDTTQVAVLIAVLIYVTKTVWEFVSHSILKAKTSTEENTMAIRELLIKIDNLNIRLAAVDDTIKDFTEVERAVWKMQKDIDFAHEKIRDIRSD